MFSTLTKLYFVKNSSATDVETGQQVAVKKLARPFQQTPVHAKRAYREIKLMKLLTKTNTNVRLFVCLLHMCSSVVTLMLIIFQVVELLDVFTPNDTIDSFTDV